MDEILDASRSHAYARIKNFFDENRDTAVFLIDMQFAFTDNIPTNILQWLIENQCYVIELCKKANLHFFEILYNQGGCTLMDLSHVIRYLPKDLCHRYVKNSDGLFFDKGAKAKIKKELLSRNITNIFLMGVNASQCVYQTAHGALMNGFKIATSPLVIANNCISEGSEAHAFQFFRKKGVFIEARD